MFIGSLGRDKTEVRLVYVTILGWLRTLFMRDFIFEFFFNDEGAVILGEGGRMWWL